MVFVHIIFIIAVIKKDFSLIDIGWGLGFILISVIAYLHHSLNMKNILLLILVSAWGLRLALHIFIRSLGKPGNELHSLPGSIILGHRILIRSCVLNKWKSKKENKGKICTTGPWGISRFPNYFGEILLWYGVYSVTFNIKTSWTIIKEELITRSTLEECLGLFLSLPWTIEPTLTFKEPD